MPLVQTATLQQFSPLPPSEGHQIYCGLDSAITHEVHPALATQAREIGDVSNEMTQPEVIYRFERELQGPYLDIMLRGWQVDELARRSAAADLREQINSLQQILNDLAFSVLDAPLNPRSQQQLKALFYDAMRLPRIVISQKGERKEAMNREVLERLSDYLYARPFISVILQIRALSKQLEVLEIEIDPGGIFRTSYNIAGTETGRPSSSSNAFGTGGNIQNIDPRLRWIFVASPGWKLGQIDAEQVEARDVGWFCGCLFDDWTYLDACESGDLHTQTAGGGPALAAGRGIWRGLPWTGNLSTDRKIADQIFYRDFSYRDMAKRGSHLCLSDDHEVLTHYGWVPISEKPDFILQWSEGKSEFAPVEHWYEANYSGEMYQFIGNSISANMTPDHRIPYKTDQRNEGPIKTRKASSGPGTHMPLGWGYVGGSEEVPARLIAAFMSDGRQGSTNRMHFHLRKKRKIARLQELCDLYDFKLDAHPDRDHYSVHGALPKYAGAFMLNWTKKCIDDFLDEYKFWDGHISATAVALFSVNKQQLEWIQTLGRIRGIGGNISKSVTRTTFSGTTKEYVTDYYRLQQNNRRWAAGADLEWTKHYVTDIKILCPTVSSSFFYVRRNGKIFVTGNSNYMGTAWTAAKSLKVPQPMMEDFQARYCRGGRLTSGEEISPAYPAIPRWWQWTAQQLQQSHLLVTPFGRRRHFFGRPGDDTTLREAIAFLPQSTTADRINRGLLEVWRKMPQIQVLGNGYDSIAFQYRDLGAEYEEEILSEIIERMRVPFRHPSGRVYEVPMEAKVGWNWGNQVTSEQVEEASRRGQRPGRLNPDGLVKWTPQRPDRRQRQKPLARRMAT